MSECKKCESFGLVFSKPYRPEEYLTGRPNSPVWIVGLNPADEIPDDVNTLERYFDEPSTVHRYFHSFRRVSLELHDRFGKSDGVAHTDLLKCHSPSWPPANLSRSSTRTIISNCSSYLLTQLRSFRPLVLVCNGGDVSSTVKSLLKPDAEVPVDCTSYITTLDKHRMCVVLSGFIGRLDNYSRRRLGAEIDVRFREMNERLGKRDVES